MSREEILASALGEAELFFPAMREARLMKSEVIKEARATVSVTPGLDEFRPPQTTPWPRLYVAGDLDRRPSGPPPWRAPCAADASSPARSPATAPSSSPPKPPPPALCAGSAVTSSQSQHHSAERAPRVRRNHQMPISNTTASNSPTQSSRKYNRREAERCDTPVPSNVASAQPALSETEPSTLSSERSRSQSPQSGADLPVLLAHPSRSLRNPS